MKISILVIGLAVVYGFAGLDNCLEVTNEILRSESPETTLSEKHETWRSECSSILSVMGQTDTLLSSLLGSEDSLETNKNLEVTYQTFLLFTDFALIYYNQYAPWSYRTFTYAKTAKDWYNWGVSSGALRRDNELRCLTYSGKVMADLWAWYEGTFADASIILLDFQDVKDHCPNSPVLMITEFINQYLIPPNTVLQTDYELSSDYYGLGNRDREGNCLMRSSFAS